MSRTLPTGFATTTEAKTFAPVFFVFLDWPTGGVYAFSGYGSIDWDSHTWLGTGTQGTISPIGETKDLRANGVTLTLSGIPSDLIADALANDSQGQAGKIWLGNMASDGTLQTDPYLIFDGVIDICPMEDSGESCTISVQLEKELIDRRLNSRRNTHEDQQIDYPGDLFFEYIAGLVDKEITWGGQSSPGSNVAPASVAPSSGGYSKDPYANPLD